VYRPEYFARCVEALDRDPGAVLAYPRTIVIDETGAKTSEYIPDWDLRSPEPYERLRIVIPRIGNFNADAETGVIRLEAMRRTRLLPRYYGGDKRLLGELSLLGTFIEVPEYLMLRRIHRGASSQNHPYRARVGSNSTAWTVEFFKGSARMAFLPSWSLLWDHVVTAWSSKLSLLQKLRITGFVVRVCRWNQGVLFSELSYMARSLLHRA
jgi:hypothetical protein